MTSKVIVPAGYAKASALLSAEYQAEYQESLGRVSGRVSGGVARQSIRRPITDVTSDCRITDKASEHFMSSRNLKCLPKMTKLMGEVPLFLLSFSVRYRFCYGVLKLLCVVLILCRAQKDIEAAWISSLGGDI